MEGFLEAGVLSFFRFLRFGFLSLVLRHPTNFGLLLLGIPRNWVVLEIVRWAAGWRYGGNMIESIRTGVEALSAFPWRGPHQNLPFRASLLDITVLVLNENIPR